MESAVVLFLTVVKILNDEVFVRYIFGLLVYACLSSSLALS